MLSKQMIPIEKDLLSKIPDQTLVDC